MHIVSMPNSYLLSSATTQKMNELWWKLVLRSSGHIYNYIKIPQFIVLKKVNIKIKAEFNSDYRCPLQAPKVLYLTPEIDSDGRWRVE